MGANRDQKPAELLRQRAKEERRLLRAEQAVERKLRAANERLASAQIRLEKAQARFNRRQARVAAALDELRQRQEARAAGPDGVAQQEPSVQSAPETNPAPIPGIAEASTLPQGEAMLIAVPAESTDGTAPARRSSKRRSQGAVTGI
ncbi:MAG: hypothetical protein QOF01_1411 [Thermomicrobiales bacterium]|nr:hypothetical protein [Thermomicrobiales bacterium]